MNISLRSLSLSSLSNSPLLTARSLSVSSSLFSFHFSTVFYNVDSLRCQKTAFSHSLSSAVKYDRYSSQLYSKLTLVSRQDLFGQTVLQDFYRCAFLECTSAGVNPGGAICLVTAEFWGDLFVSECYFFKCSSQFGGAIFSQNFYFISTKNCVEKCFASQSDHYVHAEIIGYNLRAYINYTTAFSCGSKTSNAASLIAISKCKPGISYNNFTSNLCKANKQVALCDINAGSPQSNLQFTIWTRNNESTLLRFTGAASSEYNASRLIFNENKCPSNDTFIMISHATVLNLYDSVFIGNVGIHFPDPILIGGSKLKTYRCAYDCPRPEEYEYLIDSEAVYNGIKITLNYVEILETRNCLSLYQGLTEADIFLMCILIPILVTLVIICTVLGCVLKPRWLCFWVYERDDPEPYCCCTEDCFCCCCCHDDECCRCCYHEDICFCASHPCWCDYEARNRTPELVVKPKKKSKNTKSSSKNSNEKTVMITQEQAISENMEPPVTVGVSMPLTTIRTTMRYDSEEI